MLVQSTRERICALVTAINAHRVEEDKTFVLAECDKLVVESAIPAEGGVTDFRRFTPKCHEISYELMQDCYIVHEGINTPEFRRRELLRQYIRLLA